MWKELFYFYFSGFEPHTEVLRDYSWHYACMVSLYVTYVASMVKYMSATCSTCAFTTILSFKLKNIYFWTGDTIRCIGHSLACDQPQFDL